MRKIQSGFFIVLIVFFSIPKSWSQKDNLLVTFSGVKIDHFADWELLRRPELLDYFRDEVYGRSIDLSTRINLETRVLTDEIIQKGALQMHHQEWELVFVNQSNDQDRLVIPMSVFLPEKGMVKGIFVSLNFYGNATVDSLSTILMSHSFVPENDKFKVVHHRLTEESRGTSSWRWPIIEVVESGYGIATCYAGDFAPDHKHHFKEGILRWSKTKRRFRHHQPGAIAAWAWGLNQMLSVLENASEVSNVPKIVLGHSRLGKAALWAGVQDARWDMVISNNSGCLGAAQSKRPVGEDVYRITKRFPYWFAPRLKRYAKREDQFKVDQQMLLALIAPVPLYVASAIQDEWSDPEGEYLSWCYAQEVYALYQSSVRVPCQFPKVNEPQMAEQLSMGYHVRKGDHDITLYDWKQFITFADGVFVK